MSEKQQQKIVKDLKARVSIWRSQSLNDRRRLNWAVNQYEMVVKEYRKNVEDLFAHAPKLFGLWLYQKWQRFRGKIK